MTTPVLFLHGWAMSGSVFDGIAQRLAGDFSCHAPDLPGHGHRATDPGGLDECVEIVADQVARLERPIVIGWSMGAAVAWRYLAQFGCGAVRGLVTIDMTPRMLPDDEWDLGLNAASADAILRTSARIVPDWPQMVPGIVNNLFATGSTPNPTRDDIRQMLLQQDPAHLVAVWDDLVAADARATLPAIDIPYLICAGEQSRLYRQEVSDWIARQAPDARVVRIPETGHAPHLEAPDAFCGAFRSFVAAKGLAGPTPTQDRPQ